MLAGQGKRARGDWMANVRIYSLAKELKVDSKRLMQELESQGIKVKSHMSTIDQETANLILNVFKEPENKKNSKSKPNGDGASVEEAVGASVEETVGASVEEEVPPTVSPLSKKITLSEVITVKELAGKLDCKAKDVIKWLMEIGIMSHVNQVLAAEMASSLAEKHGYEVEVIRSDFDEVLQKEVFSEEDFLPRPSVVTLMGHVDHGKTSLLDAIRQTDVTGREAGDITQHIGAYVVEVEKGMITFLDTPGHEIFTAMRSRGAKITDIVVLVVAADDGVMPQTREAIAHARSGNVPIMVAINKIDKPNANTDKIKKELAELGLTPEEWGGETIFVEVSAKEKIGLKDLLDMILLQAEILELKANSNKLARGTIIEAKLDKTRGSVATVLVQEGTLKVGDPLVTGVHYGKVRALFNSKGKKTKEATPSIPVEVLGLSGTPLAGDSFIAVEEDKKARQIGNVRLQRQRAEELANVSRVTLDDLFDQVQRGAVKELHLIIKADVQGSIEALSQALEKLNIGEVKLNVIHNAVGGITETDALLASAANAVILGFNVRPTIKAQELIEKGKIDLRLYNVIYNAIADIKAAMEGMLDPVYKEKILGRLEARALFHISKAGTVAGCYVTEGSIIRNAEVRLIRDSVVIHEGRIKALKRFKEDVNEVHNGYECGISLEKFSDFKQGDTIESFIMENVTEN